MEVVIQAQSPTAGFIATPLVCTPSDQIENAKPRIAELRNSACAANSRPRNATRRYLSCRSTDYGVQALGLKPT
jgi:hypothetical protein